MDSGLARRRWSTDTLPPSPEGEAPSGRGVYFPWWSREVEEEEEERPPPPPEEEEDEEPTAPEFW